jgi:hypothetical protein
MHHGVWVVLDRCDEVRADPIVDQIRQAAAVHRWEPPRAPRRMSEWSCRAETTAPAKATRNLSPRPAGTAADGYSVPLERGDHTGKYTTHRGWRARRQTSAFHRRTWTNASESSSKPLSQPGYAGLIADRMRDLDPNARTTPCILTAAKSSSALAPCSGPRSPDRTHPADPTPPARTRRRLRAPRGRRSPPHRTTEPPARCPDNQGRCGAVLLPKAPTWDAEQRIERPPALDPAVDRP